MLFYRHLTASRILIFSDTFLGGCVFHKQVFKFCRNIGFNVGGMALATRVCKMVRSPVARKLCPIEYSSCVRKLYLWSPDYLELAKSKYPEYATTNVQMKGFDFPVLENYQKKVHWVAKKMNLDVTDSWAQELQKLKVVRYKPKSEIVECEYLLKLYERNVQVSDVYSYKMPLFIDLILTLCPPGVKVHVHPHELAHFESRFVPEYKILELQDKLEELNTS